VLLVGQQPHCQQRGDEEQDHVDVEEQPFQRGLATIEQDDREQIAADHQERRRNQIGDRRGKIGR